MLRYPRYARNYRRLGGERMQADVLMARREGFLWHAKSQRRFASENRAVFLFETITELIPGWGLLPDISKALV